VTGAAAAPELTDARYLRLTTVRRSGVPVHTPVWFARRGDQLVVWSNADAGKVKRARHTPAVTVARCDRFGKQLEGPERAGRAEVAPDALHAELQRLMNAKYGWQKRIIDLGGAVRQRVLRRPAQPEAFLLITLEPVGGS
jgi:uncharacterized protein